MRRFIDARGSALSHVRSIFVDGHRLRDAGVHLRTAAGDLGIPYLCGAGLGFRVETADQFERESGTLLDGKAEDFGEHVGGHWLSLAVSRRSAPFVRPLRDGTLQTGSGLRRRRWRHALGATLIGNKEPSRNEVRPPWQR